ncbi:MAG: membrane protein insertion efficiency factor YidD [Ignavibacteria bacterium]|nr:membrane protein insertion efficiency factor YidD [Ignavibacteria bacterium]
MRYIFIKLIRLYQILISPILPPSCKFEPTCSNYFIDALEEYGALKGSILGIKRIFRCNPFSKGGYDPVPKKNFK